MCRYEVTSNITASNLGGACKTGKGCKMITMEGHCHIGCIRMEMWIMDDPANPKLLCRTKVSAIYTCDLLSLSFNKYELCSIYGKADLDLIYSFCSLPRSTTASRTP